MADPYKDTPWQQGDILRADELNAMQTGLSPLGTIIPWALPWNPTGADNDYSNVDKFAPFYLPCEGNIYPSSRAPALFAAMNHWFIHQVSINEVYQVTNDAIDVGPNTSGFPAGGIASVIVVQHQNDWSLDRYHWRGAPDNVWRRLGEVEEGVVLSGLKEPGLRAATDAQGISAGSLVPDGGVCRVDEYGHPIVIEAEGFCTPDFRGRAPFGVAGNDVKTGDDEILDPIILGQRHGDAKVPYHNHDIVNQGGGALTAADGGGMYAAIHLTMHCYSNGADQFSAIGRNHGFGANNDGRHTPIGNGRNMPPYTGVNFIIACGESGSATPSTRSGEVHRLHAVTNDQMIHERLADPNLSDDEREMHEATLAGEPWPPPPDEPPATRTTTTKTATKTKTTRKRKS